MCLVGSELFIRDSVGVGGYAAGNAGTGTLTVVGDAEPPAECNADFNDDDLVDGADLIILLGDWNGAGGDLDGDGDTDGEDLLLMLSSWGPCPE